MATGAAIGAGALLAPSAQAADIEVNSLGDGAADACDSDCTLRDAIAIANSNAEADAITFASTLSGTIRLVGAGDGGGIIQINPADALTITDAGPSEITISGGSTATAGRARRDTRIFDVNATAPVAFSGLTLTGGYAAGGGGGAILVNNDAADVTIEGSQLVDNGQAGIGGALSINAGDVTIDDSKLSGNFSVIEDSGGGGGAIQITGDNDLTITDSEISDNRGAAGGAIAAFADQIKYGPGSYGPTLVPQVTITGSDISDNGSTGQGGAIHTSGAAVSIADSTITGNVARSDGGASTSRKYGDLDLDRTTIADNEAGGLAGAINVLGQAGKYDDLSPASTITDSTIADNASVGDAGAIAVSALGQNNSLLVERSTLSGNESEARGGALRIVGIPGQPPPHPRARSTSSTRRSPGTPPTGAARRCSAIRASR